MIILDSTLKKLQAFTAVAPSTALTYYISYLDINTTTFATTAISSVDGTFTESTTDILAAPSSGYSRQVKSIKIYNASNATQNITLVVNNNGTQRIINKLDVTSLSLLAYEGGVWQESLAATAFLCPHAYLNNGGTAAAVTLDVMKLYIETDQ